MWQENVNYVSVTYNSNFVSGNYSHMTVNYVYAAGNYSYSS